MTLGPQDLEGDQVLISVIILISPVAHPRLAPEAQVLV